MGEDVHRHFGRESLDDGDVGIHVGGRGQPVRQSATEGVDERTVGKVDRVGDKLSSVILITDEACKVSVQVEGTPEVGILSGQRGQYESEPLLRLRFLSTKARISPGTRVFTTGLGGLFPSNILVGTVESVVPGPLDTEALVRPSVNFTDLSTVFLLPLP